MGEPLARKLSAGDGIKSGTWVLANHKFRGLQTLVESSACDLFVFHLELE